MIWAKSWMWYWVARGSWWPIARWEMPIFVSVWNKAPFLVQYWVRLSEAESGNKRARLKHEIAGRQNEHLKSFGSSSLRPQVRPQVSGYFWTFSFRIRLQFTRIRPIRQRIWIFLDRLSRVGKKILNESDNVLTGKSDIFESGASSCPVSYQVIN